MVDVPYTQPRNIQYRGPSTSDDYNARVEENFQDLMVLYNRARLTDTLMDESYRRLIKEQLSLLVYLTNLEARVDALEAGIEIISFYEDSQVTADRFIGTSFEVAVVSRLTLDIQHGIVTLPKVDTSSLSKLQFTDTNGDVQVPSTLEMSVAGVSTSVDSTVATLDTCAPEYAVLSTTGRIWVRNVVVNTPDIVNHAVMFLYVKVPTDLFTTDKSNVLTLHAFPMFATDVMDISLTTKVDPILADVDGYVPMNDTGKYAGNTSAIGWTPPGGWSGDEILRSGPKKFYFDPQIVTAFRIKMRQRHYYQEGTKFIYTYGATLLDLGYDKFLNSGKTLIEFTPRDGSTLSNVTDVEPAIYNVAESELPDVFSYRVIWETSFDSGVYTTNPVALSNRVWIEVTLNQTSGGGTPALSGLTVSYT